jgi:hypothetical protein
MDDRFEEWRTLLDPRQTAVLAVDMQVMFAKTMGPTPTNCISSCPP